MTAESRRSPVEDSSDRSASLPCLITPRNRLGFVGWFTGVTLFAFLITPPLFNLSFFNALPSTEGMLLEVGILGLSMGMVVGAVQWLVLRPYLSDRRWMIATACGICLQLMTSRLWLNWMMALYEPYYTGGLGDELSRAMGIPPSNLPPSLMLIILIGGALTIFIAPLWLGLMQWLILRYYVHAARWWIVLFPLVTIAVTAFMWVNNTIFAQWQMTSSLRIVFNQGALLAGTLGVTQAIAFCVLRRNKFKSDELDAPMNEITDYPKLRQLSRTLSRTLQDLWNHDLETRVPLRYHIHVNPQGEIVACYALNPPATDLFANTPLAKLIPSLETLPVSHPEPVGQFRLDILPPGAIAIKPLQGMPLSWIGWGMAAIVLVVSAYPTLLIAMGWGY